MPLNEHQWTLLQHFFPTPRTRRDRRCRPWASNRARLEAILWVLKTGARWRDLPAGYPSGVTCGRRLQQWEEQGVWLEAWRQMLSLLDSQLLRWDETFLDGKL
jgi:transposase